MAIPYLGALTRFCAAVTLGLRATSTALAARAGILVKDRLALEEMRTVDTVLFDKTGTLTTGQHVVRDVTGAGMAPEDVLRIAGAVEAESEHPLAKAIVTAARIAGSIPVAIEFRSIAGRGVEATVDGKRWAVGGPPPPRSGSQRSRGSDS